MSRWADTDIVIPFPVAGVVSAHSVFGGERFYYERDFESFVAGAEPVSDGFGGDKDEYIMLQLRLAEGLNFAELEEKFGEKISEDIILKMKKYEKAGLVILDGESMRLTPEGFLLSNMIIGEMID